MHMRRPAEQSQVVLFVVFIAHPLGLHVILVYSTFGGVVHGVQSLLTGHLLPLPIIDCWPLAAARCRLPVVFLSIASRILQNGGTEMAAKTHVFGQYEAAVTPFTPMTRAGECLLFDFRLRHRGVCRPPCDLLRPSHNCPTTRPSPQHHTLTHDPPLPHITPYRRASLWAPIITHIDVTPSTAMCTVA